jgi:hypothetical protein
MCVMVRYTLTTLFNQLKNQVSSKGIHRAGAVERAFSASAYRFYFQVCMHLSARIRARCQRERQAWKEENRLHCFDGLNCLKRALLSKIWHRSKIVKFVSLPFLSKLGTRQIFQKGFRPRNRAIYRNDAKMMSRAGMTDYWVTRLFKTADDHFCVTSVTRQTRH